MAADSQPKPHERAHTCMHAQYSRYRGRSFFHMGVGCSAHTLRSHTVAQTCMSSSSSRSRFCFSSNTRSWVILANERPDCMVYSLCRESLTSPRKHARRGKAPLLARAHTRTRTCSWNVCERGPGLGRLGWRKRRAMTSSFRSSFGSVPCTRLKLDRRCEAEVPLPGLGDRCSLATSCRRGTLHCGSSIA